MGSPQHALSNGLAVAAGAHPWHTYRCVVTSRCCEFGPVAQSRVGCVDKGSGGHTSEAPVVQQEGSSLADSTLTHQHTCTHARGTKPTARTLVSRQARASPHADNACAADGGWTRLHTQHVASGRGGGTRGVGRPTMHILTDPHMHVHAHTQTQPHARHPHPQHAPILGPMWNTRDHQCMYT
jgi:hypothetical protein